MCGRSVGTRSRSARGSSHSLQRRDSLINIDAWTVDHRFAGVGIGIYVLLAASGQSVFLLFQKRMVLEQQEIAAVPEMSFILSIEISMRNPYPPPFMNTSTYHAHPCQNPASAINQISALLWTLPGAQRPDHPRNLVPSAPSSDGSRSSGCLPGCPRGRRHDAMLPSGLAPVIVNAKPPPRQMLTAARRAQRSSESQPCSQRPAPCVVRAGPRSATCVQGPMRGAATTCFPLRERRSR